MEDKILVNDIITINKEKCGYAYIAFDEWFKSYGLSAYTDNYNIRLSEHIEDNGIDEKYRCIWVAPVPAGDIVYAIEGMDTKKVFLVGEEAILQYSHTLYSFDSTDQALKILTRNYHKLVWEFKDYKEFIKKNNKAVTGKSNDMPELKAGMFGISKPVPNGEINAFYVTEDTIIYEKGSWDSHDIFDKNGKSNYTQILALYGCEVKSFEVAKILYHRDIEDPVINESNLIWKKKD